MQPDENLDVQKFFEESESLFPSTSDRMRSHVEGLRDDLDKGIAILHDEIRDVERDLARLEATRECMMEQKRKLSDLLDQFNEIDASWRESKAVES